MVTSPNTPPLVPGNSDAISLTSRSINKRSVTSLTGSYPSNHLKTLEILYYLV